MDGVCTDFGELESSQQIPTADLEIYSVFFLEYVHKWKEVKQKENSQSKEIRFLLCLIRIFSNGMRKQ